MCLTLERAAVENGRSMVEDRGSTMRKRVRAILYPLSSILFLLPGCVKDTKPVALVDRSPLIVDEAMQQRKLAADGGSISKWRDACLGDWFSA